MSEHPKSSKIDIVKDAAKRAMALTEVAAVAVAGVATLDALADPGTAHAGTEAALTHEAQSPQAFIKKFDSQLLQIVQEMPSSPHFSAPNQALVDKYEKRAHTSIRYVGVPSKEYPGLTDWLAVTYVKGDPAPLNADLQIGADSKSYAKIKSSKRGFFFGQVNSADGRVTPHSMTVVDHGKSLLDGTVFEVSSVGTVQGGSVEYTSNPSKVSAEFNAFLNSARAIVTHK